MINSSTNEEYRNVFGENQIDYAKIKVGVKQLEDAILDLGNLKKSTNERIPTKEEVLRAIADKDMDKIRASSD